MYLCDSVLHITVLLSPTTHSQSVHLTADIYS